MMVCGMEGRPDLRQDMLQPYDCLVEESFHVNRTNHFVVAYAHFKIVGISMRRFSAQEH